MEMRGHVISGVKVINIVEENAASIEKMANKMIADLHKNKIKILDLQTTGDKLILVLGEKEWWFSNTNIQTKNIYLLVDNET